MAPLSNAEKQRRYRARRDSDNERRQQYLNKEKDKWKKDREEGNKRKCQTSVKEEGEKEVARRKKKLRDKARCSVMTTPPRSRDNPLDAAQQGPSRLE